MRAIPKITVVALAGSGLLGLWVHPGHPAAGAAGLGEPASTPLVAGHPVQFRNPPFTTASADAAAPWDVGWDPAKKAPAQLPPLQGQVDALFRHGDYVYVGGAFHRALGPDGVYDETVRHLVRVRWDTGELDTAWKPELGSGDRFASGTAWNFTAFDPGDGTTRLVVAGDFTRIGADTTSARYLAVFRLDDPDPPVLDTTILSTADVNINDRVHAVGHEFDGTEHVLYLGGYFTSIGTPGGNRARSHLARLRLAGDHFVLDDGWTPTLDTSGSGDAFRQWVSRIIAVPGHDRVLIGGFWTSLNHRGATREKYLAAVDKTTGAVQPWADPINKTPAGGLPASSTSQTSQFPVFDMVLLDEGGVPVLYTAHGGTNLAAKWNAVTGQRLWYRWTDGGVQAVTYLNGRVYFGFHGNYVSPVAGGVKKGSLTVRRQGLFVVSPQGDTLFAYAPSFVSPKGTTEGKLKIWALLGSGHLYVGGDFTLVEGAPRAKFAVFPVT